MLERSPTLTELMVAKQSGLIRIVETSLDTSVPYPAVFCGLPHAIIGWFNGQEKQYGAVILAISKSCANRLEVSNVSIEDLYVTCLVKLESICLCIVLVYLPQNGSKYYISISQAAEKLIYDATYFEKIRVNNYFLGDFNLPPVNWNSMTFNRPLNRYR